MKEANRPIKRGCLPDFLPRDGEDIADEHILQVLALRCRLAHGKNRCGGRHRVADSNYGLLRDARAMSADRGKHERADEGEPKAYPVDSGSMRVAACHREQ